MSNFAEIRALVAMIEKGPVRPVDFIGACKDADIGSANPLLAYNGSLDAARKFHASQIPDWDWSMARNGHASVYYNQTEHLIFTTIDGNPARAFLLVTLKAILGLADEEEPPFRLPDDEAEVG